MMKSLNDIVDVSQKGTSILRNGFVFSSIDKPANVFDSIVIRIPETCDCWTPKNNFSEHSLEEHIEFINKYKLEKARIIAENINFITLCPTLKYIEIIPADTAPENFDYSPLYNMPEIRYLNCRTQYGGQDEALSTTIDYSKIKGITEINITGKGHTNYNNIQTLQIINMSCDKVHKNLQHLIDCKNLKDLELLQCSLNSLDGIGNFKDLQQLSIFYNRSLQDISELSNVAKSLRALSIENCPKIIDFSCLNKLTNLEHLYLFGKNELPNLRFLNSMKSLKTFSFSMSIADGDLTPCLNLPYVYSEKNKKEYNLKNNDLPKVLPSEPFKIK